MGRNQERPMTEDNLEAAQAELEALREETRERLATELGGEPGDYRADADPSAD